MKFYSKVKLEVILRPLTLGYLFLQKNQMKKKSVKRWLFYIRPLLWKKISQSRKGLWMVEYGCQAEKQEMDWK